MTFSNAGRTSAAAVLALLLLAWPALLNGQPFLFPDTTTYVRGAALPIEKLFGLTSAWSAPADAELASQQPAQPADAVLVRGTALSSMPDKTVLAGRSVYYGALVLAGFASGGFWLTALLQAAVVSLAVHVLLLTFVRRSGATTLLMLAALSVLSPLPWFVSELMPDVFAGLAILACAMLLSPQTDKPGYADAFWWLLLSYALLCHSSHVALVAAMLGAAGLSAVVVKSLRGWRGFGLVGAAIVVAGLGELAFGLAVSKVTGAPPIRPPFLTARVLASETGADYLKRVCPQRNFAVCAYADRAPVVANDFLWSADPKRGAFSLADAATRRALSAEQTQVYLGALLAAPVASITTILNHWGLIVGRVGMVEFNYGALDHAYFKAKLPAPIYQQLRQTRAGQNAWPVQPLGWLFSGVALLSLLGLVALRVRAPGPLNPFDTLTVAVLIGVLLNGLICSAFSGVEDRYHARVVWLVLLLAITALLRSVGPETRPVTVRD